jgi:hypothetical protein
VSAIGRQLLLRNQKIEVYENDTLGNNTAHNLALFSPIQHICITCFEANIARRSITELGYQQNIAGKLPPKGSKQQFQP